MLRPAGAQHRRARGRSRSGPPLRGGLRTLRGGGDAVGFVRSFFEAGKPVASICHGAWTLVEADVVKGRTLTSWPSIRTDIEKIGRAHV